MIFNGGDQLRTATFNQQLISFLSLTLTLTLDLRSTTTPLAPPGTRSVRSHMGNHDDLSPLLEPTRYGLTWATWALQVTAFCHEMVDYEMFLPRFKPLRDLFEHGGESLVVL